MLNRYIRLIAIIAICGSSTLVLAHSDLSDFVNKSSSNISSTSKISASFYQFSEFESPSDLCYLSERRNSLKEFAFLTKLFKVISLIEIKETSITIRNRIQNNILSQKFLDLPPPSHLS